MPFPSTRSTLTLLVTSLLLTGPLTAQSATERAALLALADSLARDTTGERDAFDAAIQRVERTLDRHSDWAVAWQTLGRIEEAMWDRKFVVKPTAYHPAGFSHRRGAMDAYARSIKADPSYQPAATDLARLLIALGSRKLEQRYREPLQRAAEAPGAEPDVYLALSRLWYSDGNPAKALNAIDRYAEGGDPGVSAVERSRILQTLDRADDAAQAYETGLARVTANGAKAYREDIRWVGSPEEIAAADSLPSDSIGGWVRRFWRERDALEMRAPGERLREHLRRWVYAHKNYRVLRPSDAPIHSEGQRDNDQWSVVQGRDPVLAVVLSEVALGGQGWRLFERTQWEVDDRGAIYVRHGEPTQKVSSPSGPPNESWMYKRAVDRPIFHFLGSHALGTTAATTLVALLPLSPEMLTARGDLDPRYQALGEYIQGRRDILNAYAGIKSVNPAGMNGVLLEALSLIEQGYSPRSGKVLATLGRAGIATGLGSSMPTLNTSIPQTAREIELRGRATVREAMVTDGFPHTFNRQLDAIVQVHGIGVSSPAARRVLAVYAVEGGQLTPQPRPDGKPGFYYPLSIRLIALDRAGGIVHQLDTIRNYVTVDSLRAGQHLTGFLELPVPAGMYRVRALITPLGENAGAAGSRDNVDLTSGSNELVISDLILGREHGGLAWRFDGEPFPLNPLNAFPPGADAELFYEAGGLVSGQEYQVTMAVRRPGDSPPTKPLIETRFLVTAAAAYQAVRRSLGLQELTPGGYILTVTMTATGSERSESRSRALNILNR